MRDSGFLVRLRLTRRPVAVDVGARKNGAVPKRNPGDRLKPVTGPRPQQAGGPASSGIFAIEGEAQICKQKEAA